jgi:hypothetical protein
MLFPDAHPTNGLNHNPKRQRTQNGYVAVPAVANLDEHGSAEEQEHRKPAAEPDKAQRILRPRAYQIEMLEESLKRNVIVAVRQILEIRCSSRIVDC